MRSASSRMPTISELLDAQSALLSSTLAQQRSTILNASLGLNATVLQVIEARAVIRRNAETERRLAHAARMLLNACNDTAEPFVVLLAGGSNTAGGHFVGELKEWLYSAFPRRSIRLLNAGVGATGAEAPMFCMREKWLANDFSSQVHLLISEFSSNPTKRDVAARFYDKVAEMPSQPAHLVLDQVPAMWFNEFRKKQTRGPYHKARGQVIDPAFERNITVISPAVAIAPLMNWSLDPEHPPPFSKRAWFGKNDWHPSNFGHKWIAHTLIAYLASSFHMALSARGHSASTANACDGGTHPSTSGPTHRRLASKKQPVKRPPPKHPLAQHGMPNDAHQPPKAPPPLSNGTRSSMAQQDVQQWRTALSNGTLASGGLCDTNWLASGMYKALNTRQAEACAVAPLVA